MSRILAQYNQNSPYRSHLMICKCAGVYIINTLQWRMCLEIHKVQIGDNIVELIELVAQPHCLTYMYKGNKIYLYYIYVDIE